MPRTGNNKHRSGKALPVNKVKISGRVPRTTAGKKSAGGKGKTTSRRPGPAATAAAGSVPAKLLPPRLARVFSRTRLLGLLDTLRNSHAVLWVAAPPGSGKTTLVGDYIAQRKLRSLWYQLDESDSDVASFFHYLGLAAAKLGKQKEPLPHLTLEYLAGFATFTRRFFEKLFTRIKPPFVLLLDDYQELKPDSMVHEILAIAATILPRGVTIMVTSRAEPPASLAKARANGELALIGWEALRLTPEEAAGVVMLRGRGELQADVLQRLHRQTDGWAAGLTLALEQGQTGFTASPETSTPQALFDYFAAEIFNKTSPETRDVLLKTAFLPRIGETMAVQLTGNGNAGRLLAELYRRNYFTNRYGGEGGTYYQYHPLFHEFLLRSANAALPPAEFARVQSEAASLLEASGQIEDAANLRRAAADWPALARLIAAHAHALVAAGRAGTVEHWLRALPPEVLDRSAWHLYWFGQCRLPFDAEESRALFERAYAGFEAQNDLAGLGLAWSGIVDTFVYAWGDFRPLDRWIEIMEQRLAEMPEFPSPAIAARVASGMFMALMYRQPQHPQMAAWAERVKRVVIEAPDPRTQMILGNQLLLYYTAWIGDFASARILLEAVPPPAGTADTEPLVYIAWRTMQAGYHWFMAEHEACLRAVRDGLATAERTGAHPLSALLVSQGVIGSLTAGELDRAGELLRGAAATLARARPLDRAHYHYLAFLDALFRGDAASAFTHAHEAVALADTTGVPFGQALYRLGLAHALYDRGQRREALIRLAEVRRIGRGMRSLNIEFGCLFSAVFFALDRGKERLAIPLLRKTLAMARHYGYINRPLWTPTILGRLLRAALEHGIEVEYVQRLIRTRNLAPPADAGALDGWPWPVDIRALGRVAVSVQDKPLSSKKPQLPAKLSRPQAARVLARTRLYQRLDQARKYPVTWLTGPPGAGKTTLVSDYLEARGLKGIWYQVDAGDDDTATFFHYIAIAARHAVPKYRTPLPVFTPEHRPGLDVFARRYFEALYARLKAPAVLVLDNYQEVPADSAFHAVVAEAAAALPKGVRLLVLSRAEPPAAFARLRANYGLLLLDGAELKLTLDEARAVANVRDRRKLDPAALERLHERTGGWAAGLVLLLERPDLEVPAHAGASGHQVLFDYFATEIFHKLDATTQSVLCQAALLPEARAALARQITGEPGVGSVLADLYRRNYFVTKQGQGEVYRFHPLFHEFLQRRALETIPPAQLNALRTRAAALLEAAGDSEAAAELWRAASNWQALEAHVLKHAPALTAQARFQTLETWLQALPVEALESKPWLRYWLAVCRMQFNPVEAQGHFEQAHAAFTRNDEAAGLYAAWSGAAECICLAWRDFSALGPWLAVLEDLRRHHPQWPSPDIERRVVAAAVAGYSSHRPDHPDLRRWLAHAQRLIDTVADDMQRIQLATYVVMTLYWLGENRQARRLVDLLGLASGNIKNAPVTQLWWDNIVVIADWQGLMPRAALQRFDRSLVTIASTGVHSADAFLYGQAIYPALTGGDVALAETLLQALGKFARPDTPLANTHYTYLSALIHAHAGRLSAALDQTHQALALSKAAAMPFGQANCHLNLAMVLYETGELEAAREHLRATRAIGAGMGSRQVEYWCSALEAHWAFEAGDAAAGRTALALTLGLSREMDGAPMYWWPRTRVAWFYAKALELGIDTDHVCDLIRRLDLVPADPVGAPDSWPWPVKIHTLGRFAVTVRDLPLPSSGKQQRKPLDLLKLLVASGERGLPVEQAVEALCPEMAGTQAYKSYAMALHRLRKLIGEDNVLSRDGRVHLNPRTCWVDAWAFEALLAKGVQSPADAAPYPIERAAHLYAGPFLNDEAGESWAVAFRERLHRKYLEAILAHGRQLEARQDFEAALLWYRRGLDQDDLMEALYQRILHCCRVLGQRAEGIAAYERCRERLRDALGIAPSSQTDALRDVLLAL